MASIKDPEAKEGMHEKPGYKAVGEEMKAGHKMIIEKMENGGHMIEHHKPGKMSKTGAFMEHEEPERHGFGPGDHSEAAAHVMAKMGVPMDHEAMEEEPEEEEV